MKPSGRIRRLWRELGIDEPALRRRRLTLFREAQSLVHAGLGTA